MRSNHGSDLTLVLHIARLRIHPDRPAYRRKPLVPPLCGIHKRIPGSNAAGDVDMESTSPRRQRACFENINHYLTSYPSNDGLSRVYKTHLGGSNYVAQNTWWYNTSTGAISSSDIDINANYSWWNGAHEGCYDVQSVVLHEIGHSVGLSHSNNYSAVMYRYSYTNTLKRALTQDDINGVNAIY